ncbi:hypothetical protein BCR36DRAFT_295030 [Piromyces finnis]|uniref:Right handed beta helix domain-containing protein n=1 Tax=Piromyces finnis TaxID=1754191 RepID=A0A1Y1V578_9FUNG|nr:hypothetical protein BCR36DRAFT_295030 [Piromyces finnis]|eukprot:ORX47570.1 hypothetical protein BCR36DRAFT_295030 [Piromyces finnis]
MRKLVANSLYKFKKMNIKIGLFFLILITYVYSVIVDEAQFADLISKIDDEIIINIDSEIYISNDFIVNDNHKKIIIIGKSVETSFIKFENLSNKLYFGENVKEIEIKNISIIGNIFFNNIKSVFFDSVSITGNIDSYFDIDINDYIKFKNVTYNPSSYSSDNCINLSGNVEIVDSTFKGSSQCNNRLFNFFGLEYYDLYIENSNFSGEYKCGCVNIDKGHEVNIYKSTFDNAYVPKIFEGGGGLKIKNSNTHLKNCNFTNNYVMHEGGALYLEDIFGFEADGLEVVNNTAIYKGSMVFISTIEDIGSTAIFKNIRQINTGINNERIQEGGLGFRFIHKYI